MRAESGQQSSLVSTGVTLQHLAPHLREVSALLAAGLLRLRSRNENNISLIPENGESSLHFFAVQSGYAKPQLGSAA